MKSTNLSNLKILSISLLLSSSFAFARPNIVCYFQLHNATWEGMSVYSMMTWTGPSIPPGDSLGVVGIGLIPDQMPGNVLCTAETGTADDGATTGNVVLASYIVNDPAGDVDTSTCDWSGTQPYQTVSTKSVAVLPGNFAEVDGYAGDNGESQRLLNYIPTDAEISAWQALGNTQAQPEILSRCLQLVPGSIPLNGDGLKFRKSVRQFTSGSGPA